MRPVRDYEFCKLANTLNFASIIFVKVFKLVFTKNNLITCHGWLQGCFCSKGDEKNNRKKNEKELHFSIIFSTKILKLLWAQISKEWVLSKELKKCKHASNQAYQSKFEDISICSLSYLILINRKFNLPETKTLLRKRIISKELNLSNH